MGPVYLTRRNMSYASVLFLCMARYLLMNFIQPRLGNDEVSYDNFFKMHMNNIKPEVKTEPFSSFVPLMKMIEHDTEEDDTQRNFGVQYNNTLPDYYVKPEMSSPFPHGIASDSFFYGSGVKEEFPNFMTDHINTGHLESTDAGINEIVEHTYEEIKELINRTDVRCSDNVVDSTTNGYEQPQDRKQERTRLTESQRRALILEFNACNYPDLETMKDLAMSLSLSVKAVQTWFCNRRYRSAQQKERRQNKLEGKQERLKLTESQRNILLSTFNECSHPEMEKISELAKMLSLSVRTVQTWFCKQRYRSSVQQKEKPQNTIDTQQSRLKLTETQKMILVLEFNKSNLPDLETVNRLSRNLNLSPKSIQTWFANRRYRNTPQKESSNMLNEYSVPHTGVDDKNGFSGMMNLQNSLSNMSPTASATHIPTYNSSSFSHSLLHNSSPCKSLANAVMNQNESVRCKTVLSYDDDDEDDKKDGGLVIDTHVGMRKRKVKEEEHPEFSDEDDEFLRIQEKQMERLDESFKPNVPLGYLVPKFNRPTRECKKKPLVESPADSVPTSTCSSTTPTKTVLTPVSKVDKKKPYNVKKFPVIIPPKEPKQVQKPKKGMATVKQRLGRILGIHKMKF